MYFSKSPRTTKLYDRTNEEIMLDEVSASPYSSHSPRFARRSEGCC